MGELGVLVESMSAPPPAAGDPELEEAELSRIVALWDGMRFEEAGAQASQLFREGTHDIRLLVYSLHAHFVQGGPDQLDDVLATLEPVLRDHFSELRPVRLRNAHVDKRIGWLFRTIAENLRCQGTAQELGRHWARGMTDATRSALRARIDTLQALLEPLGLRDAQGALAMLWVEVDRLPQRPLLDVAEQGDGAPTTATPPTDASARVLPAAANLPTDLEQLAPQQLVISLLASSEFLGLCTKLQCFRRLLERRDFKRAAVVADDLSTLIASFDPVSYFPGLFLAYTQGMSAHIDQIAPCLQERDGLEWTILKQLYRSSPSAFAEP